eukprot:g3835.t1
MSSFPRPTNSTSLSNFLFTFAESVRENDRYKLASFFASSYSTQAETSFLSSVDLESATQQIAVGDCKPFSELLSLRLQSCVSAASGETMEAYEAEKQLSTKFLQILAGEDNWLCPTMYAVIRNLRVAAQLADAASVISRQSAYGSNKRARVEPTKCMNDCVQTLLSAFRQTVGDRAPLEVSKKVGTIFVAVNLFKVYFRVNKASKCTEVHQAIAKLPRFPKLNTFPRAHSVAYNYYVGRLHMLENSNEEAEEELSFALKHCDKRAKNNVGRILRYLVPVRILLGKLPSKKLLQTHGLNHFSGIVKALRSGNLREFQACLLQHQALFIAQGTYLVMEKLRFIAFRNCLKTVWKIRGSESRLDTGDIQAVFKWLGVFDDRYVGVDEEAASEEDRLDDVECILANLIYKGFVKGYIAHKHRKLVVSKSNAFPKITEVLRKKK